MNKLTEIRVPTQVYHDLDGTSEVKEWVHLSKQNIEEIKAYIAEVIGEDEPALSTQGDYWEACAMNQLREDQRERAGL